MKFDKLRGAIGMSSMTVRPGDTSVAHAINDLPTATLSVLIDLAESACTAVLAEHFAPGETSLTEDVQCHFVSGATIGSGIRAHATCIEVNGNNLTFTIEIHHETRLVASLTVIRKIVDRVSFLARTAAEGMLTLKNEETHAHEEARAHEEAPSE